MQREYQVKVDYDNEAGVWIATSDDITGLILEDESPEDLMKRVVEAAPELIRLNNLSTCKAINFSMTRNERMAIA
ncbi:MAG: DUF1902 domain-containing protein [Selenomonadaceae bacterium]|nr:DUF1902 domain-containing protein [Selenomonadaceae bacterium]